MSLPPKSEHLHPVVTNPTKRYLAGVARGFLLADRQRELLDRRGATVLSYRERLGIMQLQIEDVDTFKPPSFIRFLVPDDAVQANEEE